MEKMINKKNKMIILSVIVVLFFSILKKAYVFEFKYKEESVKMACMVIEKVKEKEDKVSYLVSYNNNRFLLNIYTKEKGIENSLNYKYGDVIEYRGKINRIQKLNNPYEFDYKKYLNSNDIVTTITAYDDVKYLYTKIGNPILHICYTIKEIVGENIEKKMPEKEANLYKSIIYGDDGNLDENIKETFTKDGMSHILAVSGMHLMYLILILKFILKDVPSNISKFIYYFVICSYVVISGMSISILRAGIMSIIMISNKHSSSNKKNNKYVSLLISYLLIVIYNPYSIFNVSGIFSYLATLGILMFNSLIMSYFEKIIKVNKKILPILSILSVTISSLIMVFPIQIYYFGTFEFRTFISCIAANYIVSVMCFIGFISFFLMFVPFLSDIMFNATFFFFYLLIKVSYIIANINIPSVILPRPSVIEIYVIYLCIIFLKLKKYIVFIQSKNIKKYIRIAITIFVILGTILVFILAIYRIYFEEYVIYFNVEQGNMSVIRKDRKIIVIDSGSTKEGLASSILNQFLKAKGINNIDLVLVTHMHTDHMNGIFNIDSKISKIGYSIPKEEMEEMEIFSNFVSENDIPTMQLKSGDEISFDNLKIQIVLPDSNKKIISSDIANSNSTIYLVSIFSDKNSIKKRLLYMGDATKETEEVILKNKIDGKYNLENIDILQVGHHGSNTSTSDSFIKYINPRYSIISAKKKVYGHPSKETIDKLNKYNFKYYITENKGAIVFYI